MIFQNFINADYRLHLLLGYVIRLVLICYGIYHDSISEVPYTDIDYKVFTDASRCILNGNSPYDRHTYRYTPVVAILLIPNILLHHSFGKILFCTVDIIVAVLIRLIIKNNLKEYENYRQKATKQVKLEQDSKQKQLPYKKRKSKHKYGRIQERNELDITANLSMLVWLYNPMTLAIGTRGNCDSLAGFFVLLTLYYLQCKRKYFIAGLLHGFAIHFRLYPIIYSLSLFMFLSKFSFYSTEDRQKTENNVKAIKNKASSNAKQIKNAENALVQNTKQQKIVPSFKDSKKPRTVFKIEYLLYLLPNFDQVKLVIGCILSLSVFSGLFYYLYEYKFLFETYIYHLVRTDTRHNFSLYFYLQYLTSWVKSIGIWQKVLITLPKLILLVVFSVRYGLNKISLNFAILTQTMAMVIYNPVLTSQYFVWIMAILPLCIWQIHMPGKQIVLLLSVWFAAQAAWLLPAYLLEFQGQNTFLFIWIQGVSLFCANIEILGRMIKYYMAVPKKSE